MKHQIFHDYVTQARDEGKVPRVHGNGFIQLDIDARTRVHLWGHPSIPKQTVNTGIHDHRFHFNSTIVFGRLINIDHPYEDGWQGKVFSGVYDVYTPHAREGEDTVLVRTGTRVRTFLPEVSICNARDNYNVAAGEFHESIPTEMTATITHKGAAFLGMRPRVLCRPDQTPDNEFNRYDINTDVLWDIVADFLACNV